MSRDPRVTILITGRVVIDTLTVYINDNSSERLKFVKKILVPSY